MKNTVINKPLAYISHSCFTHYFCIRGVSTAQCDQLLEMLRKNCFNGDWGTQGELLNALFVTYETTDEWEMREAFATELEEVVNDAIEQIK